MACFTLDALKELLIWLVVIVLIVGIVKVLIPTVLGWFGAPPGGGAVMTILGYILWAIVAIFVIIFAFDVISCLFGGAHPLR